MAYPHHIPTSRMSSPRFATNSDAIEVRPQTQFPMINDHSEQHSGFEQYSIKRARMIGNNHSDALPCPPPMVMQPPPQLNRGTGHIFYKTRTCTRFTCGNCRNGDNCNFRNWPHFLQDQLLLLVRPNSIPCQLMVGFFAYAKSREITVDKKTLEGRMTSFV
ncbi:zinc finger CCCH domain-containing protein 39-like [Trifolium medium]|uniref:Zinc finger CCCH domain-containing protein 39-like n=1 Tax=Trifolium medium TaxID=97028 RepID=A0A392PG92_9FABA|nr:zinc finger CCCH domain-containing protein 39-like [Trifolium medium]